MTNQINPSSEITEAQVSAFDEALRHLEAIPPKPPTPSRLTGRWLVTSRLDKIEAMVARGYSTKGVYESLREHAPDLQMSYQSFKSNLSAARVAKRTAAAAALGVKSTSKPKATPKKSSSDNGSVG